MSGTRAQNAVSEVQPHIAPTFRYLRFSMSDQMLTAVGGQWEAPCLRPAAEQLIIPSLLRKKMGGGSKCWDRVTTLRQLEEQIYSMYIQPRIDEYR